MTSHADNDSVTADASELRAARLLTVAEVAELCVLSEKSIRREVERGELRAMMLCSRLRVAPEDLEAWKRRHVFEPRFESAAAQFRWARGSATTTTAGARGALKDARLVSPDAVAAACKLSTTAIYREIHRAKLPATRLASRLRIHTHAVREWMDDHAVKGTEVDQ